MKTPRRVVRGGAGQKKRDGCNRYGQCIWRVPPGVGRLPVPSAGSTLTPPTVWRRIGRRGALRRRRIKRQGRFRARSAILCSVFPSVGGAGIVAFRPAGGLVQILVSTWLNFLIPSPCKGSKKSEGAPLPTRRRQRARGKKFLPRGSGAFPEEQVRRPSCEAQATSGCSVAYSKILSSICLLITSVVYYVFQSAVARMTI